MRRGFAVALCAALLAAVPVSVDASTKLGAKCTKAGQKSGSMVCKRVNSKLVWSKQAVSTKPAAVPAVDTQGLQPGLVRADFTGYHSDEAGWFERNAPKQTSPAVTEVDIRTGRGDDFSIEWTGYLIPTASGDWTFTSVSDDGSAVWIGAAAIDKTPKAVSLLSAPGIHGPVTVSRTISLTRGHLYPLRIQFGDATNWAQMTFTVQAPGAASATSDLRGLAWHSTMAPDPRYGIDPAYAKARMADESKAGIAENAAKFAVTQSAVLAPIDTCRLAGPEGRGFPMPKVRLPAAGTVRGIMLFVEFDDIQSTEDLSAEFTRYTDQFIPFYSAQSYGRIDLVMDYTKQPIRIPVLSSKYGMQIHNQGDPRQYLQDALTAADPTVDFSPYDFVIVIPPKQTTTMVYGPAFALAEWNDKVRTNEKVIRNGVVGDGKGNWLWLAHEVGHLFGLDHPYRYDGLTYQSEQLAIWDLMDAGQEAKEFLAWHRFLIGWLTADQVRCIDSKSTTTRRTTHLLTPIANAEPGAKAIVVRISDKEALAVEVRRNLGFDNIGEFDAGTLVYRVNTRDLQTAQLAKVLTVGEPRSDQTIAGTLRPGESVTYKGVTVKVLGSTADGDYVQVTIAG